MSNSELKASNDEPEDNASEDGVGEFSSIWQLAENQPKIWSTDLRDEDSDLGLDERMIVATSRDMGRVKIEDDYAGPYDIVSEASEEERDIDEIQNLKSRETYDEKIRADARQRFYDREEHGEDENEEGEADDEEEIYSTESSSRVREEKPDAIIGHTEPPESDNLSLLADIPLEILRDRSAVIETLHRLKTDEKSLTKRSHFLQFSVARVMSKKHETMTPEDETLTAPDTKKRYLEKLISHKTLIEEIEARHAVINDELDILQGHLETVLKQDSLTFGELLAREREIGLGLIFEKSGRLISLKAIEAALRRKVLRRDLLNRDRFKYIFYRRYYEEVKRKLRLAENLGEGMTVMDYEFLRLENEGLKEKLEERDESLEKLASKIESCVNALAHYKEKNVDSAARIYHERECLEIVGTEARDAREASNVVHELRRNMRNNYADKKRQAGMLLAIPVIREMEKTMRSLDKLRIEIEILHEESDLPTSRK